jgi:hypothetical protein
VREQVYQILQSVPPQTSYHFNVLLTFDTDFYVRVVTEPKASAAERRNGAEARVWRARMAR